MEWRDSRFPHFVGTPQGGRGTLVATAGHHPHRHWRVKTEQKLVEVCLRWTGSETEIRWADECSNERL